MSLFNGHVRLRRRVVLVTATAAAIPHVSGAKGAHIGPQECERNIESGEKKITKISEGPPAPVVVR